MTTQNMKEKLNKDMENLRKKESNKKHSGRPLKQTRTSGRQNLRAQR
jgi:hypothetical protein